MDLLYFLKVLFRKKWIILGLSILAVVVTFLLLLNKKPLYESVAQYSTGFTAETIKLADGTTAIDLFTADVKFDNVIATIKSPQVMNRVSYTLMVHDLVNPAKAYRHLNEKQKETGAYRGINADTARRILMDKLTSNQILQPDIPLERVLVEYLKLYRYDYLSLLQDMMVRRVDRTDYLDISFQSENPELSASVVNNIGREFLNYYKSLNSMRTDESAESLKSIMEGQQSKVDSLNKRLLSEKLAQGTIDPVSRTTSAMETVSSLEASLAEQRSKYNEHANRLQYLQAQLNALQSGNNSSGGSNNNAEVVRLMKKKDDLTAELARKGGNDAALQQQIDDLRSEIVLKSNSGVSKTKKSEDVTALTREINEEKALMNAASSTINEYTASIRKYMGMTNVNAGSDVKMDVIKTQLDMENKQLNNVMEKYSQVQGLSKDDPTVNFIQTRVGQVAAEPQSKKTFLKMLLSGASVFFLSSVLFLFLEIFDTSVKMPSLFNKLSKEKASSILNKVNFKKDTAFSLIMSDETSIKAKGLAVFKNNIRKLRFDLLNSEKQVFLFTSTKNKAGKSTIIEALAASLLLSKKSVLIIDLNFMNNTLTQKIGAKLMIEDLAALNKNWGAFQSQKAATDTEGLYIIGCRGGNVTPLEELYNIDLHAFLDAMKDKFDYILIEGASLNSYADSREIARYVDGIFTVFSADTSIGQMDRESLDFVAEHKSKNFGVILNKIFTDNIGF